MKQPAGMFEALVQIRDVLIRLCEVHERAEARDTEAMRRSEERMEQTLRNQTELIEAQQEIAQAHTLGRQ